MASSKWKTWDEIEAMAMLFDFVVLRNAIKGKDKLFLWLLDFLFLQIDRQVVRSMSSNLSKSHVQCPHFAGRRAARGLSASQMCECLRIRDEARHNYFEGSSGCPRNALGAVPAKARVGYRPFLRPASASPRGDREERAFVTFTARAVPPQLIRLVKSLICG